MAYMELTPQERLANSRKAIVRHMKRGQQPEDGQPMADEQAASGHRASGATWRLLKNAVAKWWNYHPAHAAWELGRPALSHYAEARPFQLLAVAAGFGAACVLLRPWRLVSMGGIALGAVKSSEFSSLLLSLVSNAGAKPSSYAQPV